CAGTAYDPGPWTPRSPSRSNDQGRGPAASSLRLDARAVSSLVARRARPLREGPARLEEVPRVPGHGLHLARGARALGRHRGPLVRAWRGARGRVGVRARPVRARAFAREPQRSPGVDHRRTRPDRMTSVPVRALLISNSGKPFLEHCKPEITSF